MKNIGLTTLYESENYGTCLQAYALTRIIKELGYGCNIIKFNRCFASENRSKIDVLRSVGIRKTADILLSKDTINRQKQKFSDFRKMYLPLAGQQYHSVSDVYGLQESYDGFVTGSDMVWSWESEAFLDYYFLKFAPEGKRIAYAPSFGNTEFTEDMKAYYRNSIAGIDYCSCRESGGAAFAADITGKECKVVLDPTMLISADDWKKQFSLKERRTGEKTALFYMFGDTPEDIKKQVKYLLGKNGVIRYIPGKFSEYRYEGKRDGDAYGPIEFLQSFSQADFILTNTFHGLVFSLIFEKPFVLFHREKKEHWAVHEERMSSLLNQVGLNERYILTDTLIGSEFMQLNYESIRLIIEGYRKSSIEYLSEALKKATES